MYVDILILDSKTVVTTPFFFTVDIAGMLDSAWYLSECVSVMVKVALNKGSSKQGNALRALIGEKNVQASFLVTLPSM